MASLGRQEPSAEQGKRLDSGAAHAGVVSEAQHQALRADIRLLSTLLGETLVRQGGEELLKLVEQVRGLARATLVEGSVEIRSLLSTLDVGTAAPLAGAARPGRWPAWAAACGGGPAGPGGLPVVSSEKTTIYLICAGQT
jgi:hypothetical protein